MNLLACVLFIACFRGIHASLILKNLLSGEQYRLNSAPFLYFGPQSETIHDAPAQYVQGYKMCSPFSNDTLRGKIVISDFSFTPCDWLDMYLNIESAGAVALVFLARYRNPGTFCYTHSQDNVHLYRSHLMTFIDVSEQEVSKELILSWKRLGMDHYSADLLPDHVTAMQSIFASWSWSFILRFLLPCGALYTSFIAAREGYDRRNTRTVGVWVFYIESPAMLLVALALMFGTFGPTMLPMKYHYGFMCLLSGSAVLTQLMLCMIMQEKIRALTDRPSRDVWKQYKCRILGASCLFLGTDCFEISVNFFVRSFFYRSDLWVVVVAFYQIMLFSVGVLFLRQAISLNRPLFAYLRHPEANPKPINSANVFRVAFWLYVAGSCTLMSVLMIVYVWLGAVGWLKSTPLSTQGYFFAVTIFTCSRIGVTYAQVCPHFPSP